MNAVPVFLRALADWWRDWVNLAVLNLAWMLCWLVVVLGPPATFAAYRLAHDFVRGQSLYPKELLVFLRKYFLVSWLWFLLQLLVAFGVYVNLGFYSTLGTGLGALLQGATLAVAALWLLLQLYALPFYMEQEQSSLPLAYRNALLTILASPFYTLLLGLMMAALLVLCIRLPFLLFFGVPLLVVITASTAVRERLQAFGKRSGASE